jgi:hypothetical protein
MSKTLDLETEVAVVFGDDGLTLHMPYYDDVEDVPTFASMAAYVFLLFQHDKEWLDLTIDRGSQLLDAFGGLDNEVTKQ